MFILVEARKTENHKTCSVLKNKRRKMQKNREHSAKCTANDLWA